MGEVLLKAEKILKDEFGCGSVAMLIVEDMQDKDVAQIKDKVAKLDGVKKALWVDDFVDLSVPKEILPKDMTDLLCNIIFNQTIFESSGRFQGRIL